MMICFKPEQLDRLSLNGRREWVVALKRSAKPRDDGRLCVDAALFNDLRGHYSQARVTPQKGACGGC